MPARRAISHEHELASPSRRRALKAAAATGTAALIWTEPTIKGLARRPAYADAASNVVSYSTLFETGMPPNQFVVGTPSLGPHGNSWTLNTTVDFFDAIVGATLTVDRTGCACSITSMMGDLAALTVKISLPVGGGMVSMVGPTVAGDTLTFVLSDLGDSQPNEPAATGVVSGATVVADCETP